MNAAPMMISAIAAGDSCPGSYGVGDLD